MALLSMAKLKVFLSLATACCVAATATEMAGSGFAEDQTPAYHRKTLIQGAYRSGEAISRQGFFEPGKRTRVRWRAKPALGNCVISLFSIFNADILFNPSIPDSQKPPWTEIAFETFGGSVNLTEAKQFQTQYITQDDPNAPPTERGEQHVQNHRLSDGTPDGARNTVAIPNIYDGRYHDFVIVFQPADLANNIDARIVYRLDGKVIRQVRGGDANDLVPPLDLYAGIWIGRDTNRWACLDTSDEPTVDDMPLNRFNKRRPNSGRVAVSFVKVDDFNPDTNLWQNVKDYRFGSQNDIDSEWNLSDWTFPSFDGAFDPSAVRVVGGNRMRLDLQTNN